MKLTKLKNSVGIDLDINSLKTNCIQITNSGYSDESNCFEVRIDYAHEIKIIYFTSDEASKKFYHDFVRHPVTDLAERMKRLEGESHE
jgi:hypothetical protein